MFCAVPPEILCCAVNPPSSLCVFCSPFFLCFLMANKSPAGGLFKVGDEPAGAVALILICLFTRRVPAKSNKHWTNFAISQYANLQHHSWLIDFYLTRAPPPLAFPQEIAIKWKLISCSGPFNPWARTFVVSWFMPSILPGDLCWV